MKPNKFIPIFASIFLVILALNFVSALIVDADYVTLYAGESGKIRINIENNHNFDIEDISVQIILANTLSDGTFVTLPFTVVGSSEKTIDDINDKDDDSVSFTLKSSTDITPGDYNIPYIVTYVNADDNDEEFTKTGTFGLRVSAKTELDFSVEIKGENIDSAIVGQTGKVSLEIINSGLGEIKSTSVQVFPQGYELLSKDKIFIGTIDADDTDLASFDVIFKSTDPVLKATITYKDFDNNEQTKTVNLPFKVYTQEEALEKGIIKKSHTGIYILILAIMIIAWIIYRKVRKAQKRRNKT